MPWYQGPTLLGAIDSIGFQNHIAPRPNQPDQVFSTTRCHGPGGQIYLCDCENVHIGWPCEMHNEALCVSFQLELRAMSSNKW